MHFVTAKGILSAKNGMNIYRGCTHGCIYCDSRSTCYGMDHDFEDIEVKENAIALLESALLRKRKKCMIGTGSMTDPYIPAEMQLENLKKALSLIYQYGFGFTVITKSDRILRDIDLLQKIHERAKCVVQITLTTHDEDLCKKLEPNVCSTKERFLVLLRLHDAGIPTVVWLCPILPFINDTEENIAGILDYCTQAKVRGIINFGMGLTLRGGNRQYFYSQLDRHFPGMKERYMRAYGTQYILSSPNGKYLTELFHRHCAQHGIMHAPAQIFQYLSTLEEKQPSRQLSLWE